MYTVFNNSKNVQHDTILLSALIAVILTSELNLASILNLGAAH